MACLCFPGTADVQVVSHDIGDRAFSTALETLICVLAMGTTAIFQGSKNARVSGGLPEAVNGEYVNGDEEP